MKVFVTVGTTPFDQLIEAVDLQFKTQKYDISCQIAGGSYQPSNHSFFSFSDRYKTQCNQADLVITHGGGATVFELLENGQKIVLVPNLFRVDKHQQDLAQFVESQGFGVVCWQLDQLASCVELALRNEFKPYHKEPFFMADDLLQYFGVDNI
jgi:beta-1,4-N-acetylglucosaminyltransferase